MDTAQVQGDARSDVGTRRFTETYLHDLLPLMPPAATSVSLSRRERTGGISGRREEEEVKS